MRKQITAALGIAAAVAIIPTAQADLNVSYQFNGLGNISIDAVGSNATPVGNVSAVVPAGSTVVQAFLYSAQYSSTFVPNVSLGGTTYSGADWTFKGQNNVGLSSYRADVTAQVAAAVGGGGGTYDFEVRENSGNSSTDGELLAVIYTNPGEQERTIAILDGFSQTTGDSFAFNFADPLLKEAGFEALMSLGISFSFQEQNARQYSQVDVNGTRLTTSAGGNDDGGAFNGGLITAGGVGDSTANPADPFALPTTATSDDELYDIASFLSDGDTSILVETLNPSNDDNIFFTAFNITAKGDVQPPNGVPDAGSTLALLGISLLGMISARRRR
jgi:hypothetical protein